MSLRRAFMVLLTLSVTSFSQAAPAPKPQAESISQKLAAARQELRGHPDEPTRERILTGLVQLRMSLARQNDPAWKTVDAEIAEHPASAKTPKLELIERLAGLWTSPRHSYLYRADGTWTMLPLADASTGIWYLEGNQFIAGPKSSEATRYTIYLITKRDFVYGSSKELFYLQRGKKFVK